MEHSFKLYYLRFPLENVVWIYDIYDNSFESENGFTHYFKESCRFCSD